MLLYFNSIKVQLKPEQIATKIAIKSISIP